MALRLRKNRNVRRSISILTTWRDNSGSVNTSTPLIQQLSYSSRTLRCTRVSTDTSTAHPAQDECCSRSTATRPPLLRMRSAAAWLITISITESCSSLCFDARIPLYYRTAHKFISCSRLNGQFPRSSNSAPCSFSLCALSETINSGSWPGWNGKTWLPEARVHQQLPKSIHDGNGYPPLPTTSGANAFAGPQCPGMSSAELRSRSLTAGSARLPCLETRDS